MSTNQTSQSPGRGNYRGPQRGRGAARGGGSFRGRGGTETPNVSNSSTSRGRGEGQRGSSPGGFRGDRGRGFSPRGGRGGGGPPPGIFREDIPIRIEDRLSQTRSNALIASFNAVPRSIEKPLRPGFGTIGRSVDIRANYFPLDIPKGFVLYEYAIAILPEPTNKKLPAAKKARIMALAERHKAFSQIIGHVAHDKAQRLVSTKELPQPLAIDIVYFDEEETKPRDNAAVYTVEFTFLKELTFNDLDHYVAGNVDYRNHDISPFISALNLVVQQHASRTGVRVSQNKYAFPNQNEVYELSPLLEARRSFFVSVRPSFDQLMLNINVGMTAFYAPGNLASAMLQFLGRSGGALPPAFGDSLKVIHDYRGYLKKCTITKVMRTTARTTMFNCPELGGRISVEEYFKKKYGRNLRHAHDLPVILVGSQATNASYLPAEVCEIAPFQVYRGRLPTEATRKMIEVACNPPNHNAEAIVNQGFSHLGLSSNKHHPILQNASIEVSNEMIGIPARILPSPQVQYKTGRTTVEEASWKLTKAKFQIGARIDRWAVLLVTSSTTDTDNYSPFTIGSTECTEFANTSMKVCRSNGMDVPSSPPTMMATPALPPPKEDPQRLRGLAHIKNTLQTNLKGPNPSLVLVLLPDGDSQIYSGIKKMCDLDFGVQSLCMLLPKARKDPGAAWKQEQYFAMVSLKLNVKLGGANHYLDPTSLAWLKAKKTMLVGIDVTHPSPGSVKGSPSIAAVVGSVNDNFVQFPTSLGLQSNQNVNKDAEEMVQGLTNLLVERINQYQKANKCLPERMIVYRDGVSEGQYDLVLEKELPRIQDAFKKFQVGQGKSKSKWTPKLSIIICGKRHEARGYAGKTEEATGNRNTKPGTVWDKGTTGVFNFDYFLQAHQGLKGQVRPTHYDVLYDENTFDADTVQTLTHNLSYLYARATKGVSLVPPAYYADIACERARAYLHFLLHAEDGASSAGKLGKSKGSAEEREMVFEKAVKAWGNGVHANIKETMFYI